MNVCSIKSSRSSAQQMKEVKRTANGKGQTHSKSKMSQASSNSMISSAHQIEQLRLREMHQIANSQTTSVGQTSNAPRSKPFTASRNAPNSKIPKYIFRTSEQCPAKQNTYAPAIKQTPKLHLSDERAVPREAKHVRSRKNSKTRTTHFE